MSKSESYSRPAVWLKDGSAVPCPPWCCNDHEDDDHPDDRVHYSEWSFRFRPALLNPLCYWPRNDGSGLKDYGEWELEVSLQQAWRDREPTVAIVPDLIHGPLGKGVKLTIDEAKKLRRALSQALALASPKLEAVHRPRLEVVEQAS